MLKKFAIALLLLIAGIFLVLLSAQIHKVFHAVFIK